MKKKKITFKLSNVWKAKVTTIVGTAIAVAIPIVAEKIDTTTVGGAIAVAVLFALSGTQPKPICEPETPKEFVDKIQVETKELKDLVKSVGKKK